MTGMKTNSRQVRRRVHIIPAAVVAVVLLALLSRGAAGFPQSQKKEVEGPKTGEATVRVLFPDGTPASGATVVIDRKRHSADASGIVKIPGVAARSGVVGGEGARKEGGLLGFFRKEVLHAGFLPVDAKAGTPLDVQLKLAPVGDMDSVCRSCHPDKDDKRSGIIKCTHPSGRVLKPALANRVRQFNAGNETLKKEGKPFYPPIVVDSSRKKGIFSEKQSVLVCLSCHSRHEETGQRTYVLMPFFDKSILCRGCHV